VEVQLDGGEDGGEVGVRVRVRVADVVRQRLQVGKAGRFGFGDVV
jgi:hypothetical protein